MEQMNRLSELVLADLYADFVGCGDGFAGGLRSKSES
jgi:hypothetical protein